jgi:ABC-2 type transport system permease protein
MVLATAVSRTRWSLAHAGVAASSLVLTLAALGLGLGIGLGDERASLLAASLVRWPALAIFSAVAVLVYGLLPRWTLPVSYLALVGAVLVDLLVEFRITGDWVATASPFAVTPALPLENFSPSPVVIMVAIAALATAAGLVAFSLRDLRG